MQLPGRPGCWRRALVDCVHLTGWAGLFAGGDQEVRALGGLLGWALEPDEWECSSWDVESTGNITRCL